MQGTILYASHFGRQFCIFKNMPDEIVINNHLAIPRSALRFKFTRGGGPGGQNVNKVETRVELLFDVANSPSLTADQRERITKHLRSRINDEGVLRIVAGESRSQWQNRELAVEQFIALLKKALKPEKKRVKTKVSRAAKEQRLQSKKRRSDVKKMRGIGFTAD